MRAHYRHAERFFGHGYIARSDGSDMGTAAVRWALDDSEIVYIGILPAPLYEDGIRMREMLMLRLSVTEVAR